MYPYILMVLVVMFYAGNILVGKALNDLPPLTLAFSRLVVAFIVLFPIGFLSAWKERSAFWEHRRPLLLMTVTGVTFFNTFIYGALHFTTATNVSVLESVIPVVTIILSAVMLKEKLRGIQWAGALLSFLGAVLVVLKGKVFQLASVSWNIGDVIMIGAIVSWALYSIYVKRYMHLFPSFAALFLMTGISVMVLLPVVFVEWLIGGIPTIAFPSHIAGFLYLGIFPSVVALVLYNRAVDLLSPSQASVFLNLLPVVTMAGAYIWLNETITVIQLVGALVVVAGVFLTTQSGRRQEKAKS